MDASSSGVQHLHYGTSMPPGGVHPIKSTKKAASIFLPFSCSDSLATADYFV
jgi:hypothetical protein